MISEAKIKKLENKLNQFDLINEKRERDILKMYPNEKIYRFDGMIIPESVFKRITKKD